MISKNKGRVSVIIPAYNAEKFLVRAVESALLQGDCLCEIIIVDNNSTDGTAALIRDLEERYSGLIIATGCDRQGPAAARNHGVEMAKGDWVQFLDADDYLYAGKVKRQLGLVNKNTQWVIGVSDVVKNSKVISTFVLEEDHWRGLLFCRGLGDTNANLFRREALIRQGGYDPLPVGEDYHLYFKLLRSDNAYVKDEQQGSAYVQHDGFRGKGRGWEDRQKFRWHFVNEVVEYLIVNNVKYVSNNLPVLQTAKIAAIRMYMTADFQGGMALYFGNFPNETIWAKMSAGNLPFYWPIYQVIGFTETERIRLALVRMIPNIIRRYARNFLRL